MVKLKRYSKNPILKPIRSHSWEQYVFNPAVVSLGGKIHFIYRALGKDKISRFGYASSKDGFHIDERLEKPIYIPRIEAAERVVEFNNAGVEDPRLTLIKDRIYMTYTAVNGRIGQVALASIKVKNFLNKRWRWRRHGVLFPDILNKNAVLFSEKINGYYVLYHRFEPNIWVSYSKDLKKWSAPKIVMRPRDDMWDNLKIGAGAPPLKLKNKWLFIYHGVEQKKEKRIYRLGYVFVAKRDPERILFRSKKSLLEPVKEYEKKGQIPNVVFSCGAVIKGDQLFVYYGAADSVIGVATADISKFL